VDFLGFSAFYQKTMLVIGAESGGVSNVSTGKNFFDTFCHCIHFNNKNVNE
jgi:hypothetical protein